MSEGHGFQISSWIHKASAVASALAILSGILVLAGWAWDINILKSLFLGQRAIPLSTGVTDILAGLSLWMVLESRVGMPPHRGMVWMGKITAILVIVSGALTLGWCVFGLNLGVDHILVAATKPPVNQFLSLLATALAGLSFVFWGCGILLLDWKKRRRGPQPAEFFAFVVILDGMFGLFGYLLYSPPNLIGVSPGAALVLCILGTGLLTARSDHQFRKLLTSEFSGGGLFRLLLPAAVVIPIAFASLIWWGLAAWHGQLFPPTIAAKESLARETDLILLVVMSITAFVLIIMWTAGSLDEADRARHQTTAELKIRARQQAAIAELGQRALSGIDAGTLMNQTVEIVARTLGVEYCKVQELLPYGENLILRAGIGWHEDLVGHAIVAARAGSQSGYTLMSDGPVIVSDLNKEKRFIPSPLLTSQGVVSGLGVIIPGKKRPFGVLGAHTARQRQFTTDDINFLQAAANVLAAAIVRRGTEEDLRKSIRALRTLGECNLAMVRATRETELLQKVCTLMVEEGGYRMAWVGYAEQDESKTVRPAAVAGADEGYLASVRITWADDEHGRGPTGTAIRTGCPSVVRNVSQDDNFRPWREDAIQHGYASTVALPLMANGQAFGVFRVYSESAYAFDEPELQLLSKLADDVAYGIQALRTRVERAQVAEALRESEERFRQMAENIHEVLWLADASGTKILYVSPKYQAVWGRSPDGLFQDRLNWLEAVHPEDRSRVQRALRQRIPEQEFEVEFRVVWPDKSVHWLRDWSFPVLDEHGQVQRTVGITEDITERRHAAEALLESEERYRQLFNKMIVGCALLDVVSDERGIPRDARFVDVNPTFENLTKSARESVIGKTVREVFPEIQAYWIERLGRVAQTGESLHFEAFSDTFGKYFDMTAFRPHLGRFAIVFADITERKQAEQALEDAERKYRSIFENAMEGIFQAAENGRILTANPAMARMLGYETTQEFTQEARSLEQHFYIEPHLPRGFFPLLKQQGSISEFETQMRRKDGTVIWVIGSAYAVRDDSGKILHYEGTLRDITEHKRAEESLRRLSSQLLHAQDDERRRIARELHDSTGQYLAALAMNLSWINQSSGEQDPKIQGVVEESIDLVKRSVSEIRSFSYLLHPPVLDEYGLCAALQWYAQGFSKRSRIHIEVSCPCELPRLAPQTETALFRVVQECLTNVHRHSGSSSAKICLARGLSSLTLEVSDEGHGILLESSDNAAAGQGAGVGITGMKERMRELGGHLDIESGRHGTTVRATVPLETSEMAT